MHSIKENQKETLAGGSVIDVSDGWSAEPELNWSRRWQGS